MPTIEFIGYSAEESDRLVEAMREALADLPFRSDVFLVTEPATPRLVQNLDGQKLPLVRVYSRSVDKLATLRDRLAAFSEVETVQIDYSPKRR